MDSSKVETPMDVVVELMACFLYFTLYQILLKFSGLVSLTHIDLFYWDDEIQFANEIPAWRTKYKIIISMINTDEHWIAHHHDNRKYIQIDYQYQCRKQVMLLNTLGHTCQYGTNRTFRQIF